MHLMSISIGPSSQAIVHELSEKSNSLEQLCFYDMLQVRKQHPLFKYLGLPKFEKENSEI